MRFRKTSLGGVVIIEPDIHTDIRGENFMLWQSELYKFLNVDFLEHNIFTVRKNVLSGIHYSPSCSKLYQCLYGTAYYVLINCDEFDKKFGTWESFILSDWKHYQLFKPPQYATGLLALSDYVIVHVMQSEIYNPSNPNQKTFRYDDPRFNIMWPIDNPILSRRDRSSEPES